MFNESDHARNPFAVANAKNLSVDEIVETFIVTRDFMRLLEPRHHVVLGSRGSGKTSLAKMLSHEYLARLDEGFAKELIDRRRIVGVYIPTNLEWVGALKAKPWAGDTESDELYFTWRLNLNTCKALVATVRSCIDVYIGRNAASARTELEVANRLSELWFGKGSLLNDLKGVARRIESIEYEVEVTLASRRFIGEEDAFKFVGYPAFMTEPFVPFKAAVRAVASVDILGLEKARWYVCLDEVEFLEARHQRILNSFLRAHPSDPELIFKLTTMPYCHYTKETNVGAFLNPEHDFEYIYIDKDPAADDEVKALAARIFQRRAELSGQFGDDVSLNSIFGPSPLLGRKSSQWAIDGPEMAELREFATPETVARATKLFSDEQQFKNQISRKLGGALLLRRKAKSVRGKQKTGVFCGASLIIRCSDGNPRRLLHLFNRLLARMKSERDAPLKASTQEDVLNKYGKALFERAQSEPRVGRELYDLLRKMRSSLQAGFYQNQISTDLVSSLAVGGDERELMTVLKEAVGLGYFYPNMSIAAPDDLPEEGGTFHLSYAFCPYFRLMPRRGAARSIRWFEGKEDQEAVQTQQGLFDHES